MTQQVRSAYRKHRKRTWGFALLAVALLAVVMIPIAAGAPDKTYTLLYPAAGAVTPAGVTGSTTSQTLCADNSYTVKLELKNTAKTVSLGSANISFPTSVTLTGTPTVTGGSTAQSASRTGNLVRLRDLVLPKFGVATVTVTLDAGAADTGQSITAVVKQSNDFNDTGGDANLFSNPDFPTIVIDPCAVTISGTVFNDKNENGAPDSASFETRQAWNISLYKKNTLGTYDPADSTTSDGTTGLYSFTVSKNKDYVVCETAPSGSWVQTVPSTTPSPCATGSQEPNGWSLTNVTANQSNKDFGNLATTVLQCGETASGNTQYTVKAGSDSNCKTGTSSVDYIYEKWTEGTDQFAAFHPALSGATCNVASTTPQTCTYFVMKVTWSFGTDLQPDPANRSLKYDDFKPAGGTFSYEPMRYCQVDPRVSGSELDLQPNLGTPAVVKATILPDDVPARTDGDPQTSCLITSTESVGPTGISRVDYVFTAIDGRMLTP
jgi:hypothetical protein